MSAWHRHTLDPVHTVHHELGLLGVPIPEGEGGLGLGVHECCLVCEELARSWLTVGSLVARGNGYTKQYAVERCWRDARRAKSFEGTSEIQRRIIADGLIADRPLDLAGDDPGDRPA